MSLSNTKNVDETPTIPSREDVIISYVHSLLSASNSKIRAPIPAELNEIREIHELRNLICCLREFITAIAEGELEFQTKERGYLVGTLKTLQSNLLHLTHQIECVGKGEFNNTISFLGNFSNAFNKMAQRLHEKVSGLETLSSEYQELSSRDSLTGLYNRLGFFYGIERLLLGCTLPIPTATLIIVDIDFFKHINDTYGHTFGDDVLKHIATTLLTGIRTTSLACRYGGEEFLLFLPETSIQNGRFIAERLRKAIMAMTLRTRPDVKITASFGIVEVSLNNHTHPVEEFLRPFITQADTNLYKAKNSGRNCVVS